MNEQRNPLITLLVTAVAMTCCVAAAAIWHISHSYEQQMFAQLEALVSTQSRVINAAATLEALYSSRAETQPSETPAESSAESDAIDQLIDANRGLHGLGRSGEYMLAKREGNEIVFLLNRRFGSQEVPAPLPMHAGSATAMRKALEGNRGSTIGLDYRGERVMSAYEPIESLGWGLVAKIDLREARHPVLGATAVAAVGVLLVAIAGAVLVSRSSRPRITKPLEDSPKLTATESPESVIASISTDLMHATDEGLDEIVDSALETIGRLMHADRVYVIALSASRQSVRFTQEWTDECVESVKAALGEVPFSAYPFKWTNLETGSLLHVPNLHVLPAQGVFDLATLQREGGESYLVVSTSVSDRTTYVVAFDTVHGPDAWPEGANSVLVSTTELLSKALMRRQQEEEKAYQRELEALVPLAASALLRRNNESAPSAIKEVFDKICEVTGANRSYAARFSDDTETLTVFAHAGSTADSDDKPLVCDDIAFTAGTVLRSDTLIVRSLEEEPSPVAREKEGLHATGTRAWMVVPLVFAGKVAGLLGVDCLQSDAAWCLPSWPAHGADVLSSIGEVSLAALNHDHAQETETPDVVGGLVDALPGVAYRSNNDTDSPLEFISDGCIELTGYDPEIFLSGEVTLSSLIDPEFTEHVREVVQASLDENSDYELVYRIRDRGGQDKWIWDRGAGIYSSDGGVEGLQGFLTDITNVKFAEDELRFSEERLQLAVDAAGLALWEWDLESNAMWWSPRLAELLGDDGGFEPLFADFEDRLHPDDRAGVVAGLRRHAKDNSEFLLECRVRDLQGHYQVVVLQGQSILDDADRTVKLAGSVSLAQQNSEVHPGQPSQDTASGHDQHDQKVEAVEAFAEGIARDLEELLGPMIGDVKLGIDKATGEDADLQMHLKHILDAGNRAKRLVDQLRSIGAADDDEAAELDLRKPVAAAVNRTTTATDGEVRIKQNLQRRAAMMIGHEARLEELVVNLCTNACEAVSGTGGTVTVELHSEDHAATVDTTAGVSLKLTVKDDGIGMDEETQSRMFDPFFTTKAAGESAGQWAGLGLSVVQGIVRAHGGRITVESTPGRGTCVEVYFPVGSGSTRTDSDTGTASKDISQKVLLVAADGAVLDTVRAMLATHGYLVTALTDSRDALRVFSSNPHDYDVVVLDYALPRLNGAELARELVRVRKDVPIIVSPGFKQAVSGNNSRAGKRGGEDYDIADLGKAIKMALADKPSA